MPRVLRAFALWLLLLSCWSECRAALFWVSPSGTGSGTGATPANSISQSNFVTSVASGGGDTGIFLDGTYSSVYLQSHSTWIYGSNLWGAVIVGSPGAHALAGFDTWKSNRISRIRVASSYKSGIKGGANANGWTIEDVVVQKAGRGDPSWVTNTVGSFSGQGIEFHNVADLTVIRALVENCGAHLPLDHGFYVNGTNILLQGCISRTNLSWGIQIYEGTGDNQNVTVEACLVHDNGTPGYSQSGLVAYTYGAKQNKIRNCTIISKANCYGLIINQANASARFGITNSIIYGDAGYGSIAATGAAGTNGVPTDYNLRNNFISGEPRGPNEVLNATPAFDSTTSARYWLTASSPARGIALSTVFPTTNFFGAPQTSSTDVGFVQYDAQLETDDSRNLGDYARDPWIREPQGVTIQSTGSALKIDWTELDINHHTSYGVSRKDSVGNTYAVRTTINRGTTTFSDPFTGLTNGVTYTYTLDPNTQLGNGGGIHSVPVALVATIIPAIPFPGINLVAPLVAPPINSLKTATSRRFN